MFIILYILVFLNRFIFQTFVVFFLCLNLFSSFLHLIYVFTQNHIKVIFRYKFKFVFLRIFVTFDLIEIFLHFIKITVFFSSESYFFLDFIELDSLLYITRYLKPGSQNRLQVLRIQPHRSGPKKPPFVLLSFLLFCSRGRALDER